ncbi:MAG: DUF1080 domain-containing protein [Rubripirellula sp.]
MNSKTIGSLFPISTSALLTIILFSHSAVIAEDSKQRGGWVRKLLAGRRTVNHPIKSETLGWKELKGDWVVSQFGGDGPVEITDSLISFGFGDPMTGIRWEGDLQKDHYEIELEARRTDGFDFFCGVTFPIVDSNASFILGGWGGGIVGISSIDGRDASENETTDFRNFDNDRWYKVRVRVDSYQIQCWIDDKLACDVPRAEKKFDIRYEMDQCVPLGVANFQCKSELRNLRYRALTAAEMAAAAKMAADSKE